MRAKPGTKPVPRTGRARRRNMNQIKCPNCGEVFTVDESGYNEIVRQVRDETFEKEIERSIKAADRKSVV